jgi:hypothetical protein
MTVPVVCAPYWPSLLHNADIKPVAQNQSKVKRQFNARLAFSINLDSSVSAVIRYGWMVRVPVPSGAWVFLFATASR